jgi:glutathione S-transferase
MSAPLTLYYAPHTCALAVHIALEQAGATYDTVRIDFSRNEQRSADYLRLNPKGRVPALVTERGVLTEVPALLQYVAQRFPAAGLAPLDDTFELARFNSFNSYLCSTVHIAHAHRFRGTRWVDDAAALEAMKMKVPQSVGDACAPIEHEFLQGPWVLGERYSACDAYLFTIAGWLEGDGVDLSKLPRVMAHRARLLADPVVARVLEAEKAVR